jgi:hypothetical protein
MVTYYRVFLHVLRIAAVIGLLVSSIITLIVLLDLVIRLGFGYPWWTVFIVTPTAAFFFLVARVASKALKARCATTNNGA